MTRPSDATPQVSLAAVLIITMLGSVSTGVFWNAISFIAKYGYDFSEERNAVLYLIMGVVYAVGAFTSGPVSRRWSRRLTVRGVLAVAFAGQAIGTALPWLDPREWTLWTSALIVSYLSSVVWPIVESYLVSGRHGRAMRSAIGWFNVVWMTFVAVPLIAMAPFLQAHAPLIVPAVAVINVLAALATALVPPRPAAHDVDETARHVGDEYGWLRRSVQVLLPISYVLIAAVTPVVPYRFEALEVPVEFQTPIKASWMIVRVAVVIVMWRVAFWHGRWGALLASGVLIGAGYGLIIVAPTLGLMLVGFAAFGAGLGMVYYAALYYALAVGAAEVDAGGRHEGLIGLGYTAGPMAILIGYAVHAVAALDRTWAILIPVGMLFLLAALAAFGPYRRARARRAA